MDIIEVVENLNNFLEQSFVFRAIKSLLGFYLVVMVLAMIGILFRIGKSYWTVLVTGQEFPKVQEGQFQTRWNRVEGLVASGKASNWQAAVLEAAQMLDEVLKITQHPGETLGERLERMTSQQLDNLDQVREANRIKNKIVQDETFQLSQEEARRMVEIFGNALRFYEAIY